MRVERKARGCRGAQLQVWKEREVSTEMETSLALANGEEDSLLDDIARGVVGELDAVEKGRVSSS